MTMFVLSPSVETTTASASSIPARRRTSMSIPWPSTKPPAQWSPRRPRASSFSSTAVTSHPSRSSWRAMLEPTRPQPITNAFMWVTLALRQTVVPAKPHDLFSGIASDALGLRAVFLHHAFRKGHHEHLAGCLAQDVLDRRREETRLPAPARRRADHDQVVAATPGLVDDRVADRAGTDRLDLHLHAAVGAEQPCLGQRGRRRLLLLVELGLERPVERHADHEQRLDVRVAVAGELDRGRDHLLADRAELHRHENAGELALREALGRRLHVLE